MASGHYQLPTATNPQRGEPARVRITIESMGYGIPYWTIPDQYPGSVQTHI